MIPPLSSEAIHMFGMVTEPVFKLGLTVPVLMDGELQLGSFLENQKGYRCYTDLVRGETEAAQWEEGILEPDRQNPEMDWLLQRWSEDMAMMSAPKGTELELFETECRRLIFSARDEVWLDQRRGGTSLHLSNKVGRFGEFNAEVSLSSGVKFWAPILQSGSDLNSLKASSHDLSSWLFTVGEIATDVLMQLFRGDIEVLMGGFGVHVGTTAGEASFRLGSELQHRLTIPEEEIPEGVPYSLKLTPELKPEYEIDIRNGSEHSKLHVGQSVAIESSGAHLNAWLEEVFLTAHGEIQQGQ